MNPVFATKNELIFSSPVPKQDEISNGQNPAALYAQAPGSSPRRLTFGSTAALEPTALADGRILFVSAHAAPSSGARPSFGLFTINNDGTELTPFALDHDGADLVRRPRELPDGRVAFLADQARDGSGQFMAEAVRSARPFVSRAPLLPFPASRCYSVEPSDLGTLLVCLDTRGSVGRSMTGSSAVYRIGIETNGPGHVLFDDPAWHEVEASALAAHSAPMGHSSAISAKKKTGTLLCLNANFTRASASGAPAARKAVRVRVLAGACPNECRSLGEIVLQSDGSFMAEVPSDIPLGFETLDAQGEVVQRLPPSLWVRPGENRSCLGCHEPHNRSPRNVRPLAVLAPLAVLTNGSPTLAPKSP